MAEYSNAVQKLEGLVTSYKGLVVNMDAALDTARKASNHALAALIANDRRGLDVFIDESAGTGILPLASEYISLLSQRYASQVQAPQETTAQVGKSRTRKASDYGTLLSSLVQETPKDSYTKDEVKEYLKQHLPKAKRISVGALDNVMKKLGYQVKGQKYIRRNEGEGGTSPKVPTKVKPLMGQYILGNEIRSIAGYEKPEFYARLEKGKVPTKGARRGKKYLINKSTIPILFGK